MDAVGKFLIGKGVKPMERNWLFACTSVALAALLMSLANVGAGSTIGGLGALVAVLSALFVRNLRWKLLLYVPAAYVVALILSLMLVPLSVSIRDSTGLVGSAGCSGWNRYIGEYNEYSEPLNDRLENLRNYSSLTHAQTQTIIDAFNNDVENWRASDPPAQAEALNEQLIVVLQGWIGVFEALRDGLYTDQMLFDLQVADDELERLTREANMACDA